MCSVCERIRRRQRGKRIGRRQVDRTHRQQEPGRRGIPIAVLHRDQYRSRINWIRNRVGRDRQGAVSAAAAEGKARADRGPIERLRPNKSTGPVGSVSSLTVKLSVRGMIIRRVGVAEGTDGRRGVVVGDGVAADSDQVVGHGAGGAIGVGGAEVTGIGRANAISGRALKFGHDADAEVGIVGHARKAGRGRS